MVEWEFRFRFGRWLKYVRVSSGLSQVDFAGGLNLRLADLRSWETGNTVPDAYQFYLLVSRFGMPDFLCACDNNHNVIL